MPKAKKWQVCVNRLKESLHSPTAAGKRVKLDSLQLDEDGRLLCKVCGKSLKNRGSLRTHMERFHCEEKLYDCAFCNRKFKTNGDLKV